jgi:hypothetical protein
MQTVGGRAVSFLATDPASIDIGDICFHLSRMKRFNCAVKWTVAAHSRLTYQIVKDTVPNDKAAQLAALIHDFHEYATGDRTTPLQRAEAMLMPTGWPSPIKTIQDNIDLAIAKHFGIDWQDIVDAKLIVKRADLIALATEKAQFMAKEPMPWGVPDMPEPYDIELVVVGEAQNEWLLRCDFDRALTAYRLTKIAKQIAAE